MFKEDVIDRENEREEEKRQREAKYQYLHLSAEERKVVDQVLKGNINMDDLPKLSSRVVRIFVSSTFTGKLLQ